MRPLEVLQLLLLLQHGLFVFLTVSPRGSEAVRCQVCEDAGLKSPEMKCEKLIVRKKNIQEGPFFA